MFSYFAKIKLANEKNRQQLGIYQNLNIKDKQFFINSQKVSCDGNLFFQAGAPVTAIRVSNSHLYISRSGGQLTVIDLVKPEQTTEFAAPVLSDFYIDESGIYGTDFFNDQIVRFIFEKGKVIVESVYPKVGHPSALTRGPKGYFYIAGYASGNITKIIGRDGFLFLSGLDRIVDMEASDSAQLVIARYEAEPALLAINLNDYKQSVIKQNGSVSSPISDNDSLWVVYNQEGQSAIGKISGERLIDNQLLHCSFPVKIAVWQDQLFYTSLEDNEGKIYWINKNLQKNGK